MLDLTVELCRECGEERGERALSGICQKEGEGEIRWRVTGYKMIRDQEPERDSRGEGCCAGHQCGNRNNSPTQCLLLIGGG